ncbi:hypothetical protein MPTK1_8g12780 [Marchantia polymorpha subsp. ruderalis]|uniref:Uncharacterized protein n=1 Tax=Marchantia polymorpha TaxID=3197 RepID=A0A2R6WJN8_MARPO|nr:hypothetical protein MARPO_0083s0042 [Marchantia polymorpha]BBN19690.1 hypothetical protein Mp_8g12780 [Marchantia polymorpha subsp. ruderalis]|eukprot:PTQ34077.1 hypothetical protein MARPO_0083s0042 [Marchantia polymorpha]
MDNPPETKLKKKGRRACDCPTGRGTVRKGRTFRKFTISGLSPRPTGEARRALTSQKRLSHQNPICEEAYFDEDNGNQMMKLQLDLSTTLYFRYIPCAMINPVIPQINPLHQLTLMNIKVSFQGYMLKDTWIENDSVHVRQLGYSSGMWVARWILVSSTAE